MTEIHEDRALLEEALRRARKELEIPHGFPPEVLRAAAEAATRGPISDPERVDRREIPFVTIDPPGSRDLDQAVQIERRGSGYRVHYAIADVGAFVKRGSAIEREAWERGLTYYAPDHREPLYPEALSQGAASLLPDEDRPCVLFTLDLDDRGELTEHRVERARVRSLAQLTYGEVLREVEEGEPGEEPWRGTLPLLREVGVLRREREAERGGVSLPIRSQQVERSAASRLGYELVYERPNAAEDWNAQISLLTGHAAALRMCAAGVGLLRTLAPPREEELERFRLAARALGFTWPEERSYAEFLRGIDPTHPLALALVWQARRVMRGADYRAFSGGAPGNASHAALAFHYAHCTAPLRRLADRYVLDLLLSLENGGASDREVETLEELPSVMERSQRKSGRLERRVVDIAEAWSLRDRVGEHFPAVVLDVEGSQADVQVERPAVRARAALAEGPEPRSGEHVRVLLRAVVVEEGQVDFAVDPA